MIAALLLTALASQPQHLVLGEEPARALLTIEAREEPRLSASAGRIENLRRDGESRWLADYLPPEETIPRIAIVSAIDGDQLSWLSIPLWGQGDALVQTRPHARIRVNIGASSFGPVQADERGEAVVPVVVPPGVHEALQRGRAIDLHVPAAPLLHLVLLAARARADRVEPVQVRVLAVDEQGAPRAGAKLVFRATLGEVGPVVEGAPGELQAVWTVPPGAARDERLSVALAESPSLPVEAALTRSPGPVAEIALAADRPGLVAGEPAPLLVRASARDAAGNPSTEPLVLDGGRETAPGAWEMRAPGRIEGPLTLVVHPRGRAEPRATLEVPVLPAAASGVVLEPALAQVRMGSSLRLRARRVDRFGNLVASAAPAASAEEGSLGDVAAQPDGAWLATWQPPPRWRKGDAVVEVRWGEERARSLIAIVPRDSLFALSPKLGGVTNFARLRSPLLGLEAALRTDRFGPELAFSLEADWSFAANTQSAGGFDTRARENFFALSAQVAFRQRLGLRTVVFAGAGPSLTLVTSRVRVDASPGFTESGAAPGALLSAGVELRLSRAIPFGELRWSWQADPSFSTLRGPVSAVSLVVGSRFELR